MIRTVQMTDKEQVKLYMTLPKKKLAEMLLECNKHIDRQRSVGQAWYSVQPTQTSSNDGYTYEATITSTASYPTDKSKSTKNCKAGLAKKGRRVKRVGSKKR